VISEAEWNANVDSWLPSGADRAFVASLMGRVVEPVCSDLHFGLGQR